MSLPQQVEEKPDFEGRLQGSFRGVMRWSQLTDLWTRIREQEGWFVYLVGEAPPAVAEAPAELGRFLDELEALLRREHDYDYCGIVYADSLEAPELIKVYDPGNLGASCGSSGVKILPRWIITRIPPVALQPQEILPEGRRRWWRRIFGGA